MLGSEVQLVCFHCRYLGVHSPVPVQGRKQALYAQAAFTCGGIRSRSK